MAALFIPGFGASAGLYRPGLPPGWSALQPPSFRTSRGELEVYRRWLGAELERSAAPVALAGHSMGAALALLAAAERPELVERLVLIAPAGLPLHKPIAASLATFLGHLARGYYPPRELVRSLAPIAVAPRAALALARTLHGLDLRDELEPLLGARVPTTVIGCGQDALVTPAHCRRLAELLAAPYRELDDPAGHIWLIARPELLQAELAR